VPYWKLEGCGLGVVTVRRNGLFGNNIANRLSTREVVHSITCQSFFESASPFPNSFQRRLPALTQRGEHVSELSTHDRAVALLVEHPQTLNKVLKRSPVLGLADVLVDGQELVKVQHFGLHIWRENVTEDVVICTAVFVLTQRSKIKIIRFYFSYFH